jgi:hypothetical protein
VPSFLQETAKANTPTQAPPGVQGTYLRPLTRDGSDPGIALILINMQGGMSHFDTFDPRGESVDRIFKGPFDAIETSARGVYIAEPFQKLKDHMHKMVVVRNLYHNESNHSQATALMLTGSEELAAGSGDFYRDSANAAPVKQLTDHLFRTGIPGSDYIVFHYAEPLVPDNLFPFPTPFAGVNNDRVGSMYVTHDGTNYRNPFSGNFDEVRFREREGLLDGFNRGSTLSITSHQVQRWDAIQTHARSRLTGPLRHAFDLSREPAMIRDKYGRTPIGDGLLTCRKLVESGARVLIMDWGHFDQHYQLERHLRRLLPPFDKALSALIEDVEARGLKVVIGVVSEFGRTPRINNTNGRDHHPHSNSMLLYENETGSRTPKGIAIGRTRDTDGEIIGPASDARRLGDTFMHKLGYGKFHIRGTVRTNDPAYNPLQI